MSHRPDPSRRSDRSGSTALTARLALTLLAAGGLLSGCAPQKISTRPARSVSNMVSGEEMARRLGMQVTRSGRSSISMADGMNTLVILGPPRATMILNGKRFDAVGHVASVGQRLAVGAEMIDRIRARLRRKPTPLPVRVPPTVSPARRGGLVALDAGHGGKDPGAPNKFGPAEKVIVLDTVKRIDQALRAAGVRTVLIRNDDHFVELNDRAAIANKAGADLFVSIHADSHPDPGIRGFTVYTSRNPSKGAIALSGSITCSMKPHCDEYRGQRKADYRVLVKTKMPAVLVELGYLTNWADSHKLSTAPYRQELAEAVAGGILNRLAGH